MRWLVPRDPYTASSTTSHPADERTFTVIHPFHPLRGRVLGLVSLHKAWGEDRVSYVNSLDGGIDHVPAQWTDVVPLDPFVAISAGRAHFRMADLLEMVQLLKGLENCDLV